MAFKTGLQNHTANPKRELPKFNEYKLANQPNFCALFNQKSALFNQKKLFCPSIPQIQFKSVSQEPNI